MSVANTARALRAPRRSWQLATTCLMLAGGLLWTGGPARAQTPAPPTPTATPTATATAAPNMDEVMRELRQLRQEVRDTRQLKERIGQLENELSNLKTSSPTSGPAVPNSALPGAAPAAGPDAGTPYRSGAPSVEPEAPDDNFPMTASYKYSYNATGPLGGGGYTRLATPDDEFTVNLQNQITIDGTFFDRANMPTTEQGFNIPFHRDFIYGNVTKNVHYQVGVQGFLGTFNLLDAWMSYSFGDWLSVRAGKGLAPPLYEYYAFSPALEPVITNSPLFQMAAARPIGIMATGNLFDGRIQYWSGINNTAKSTFFALNRQMEYNGAVDLKPFANNDGVLKGLGGGVGFSAGDQQYALSQSGIGFSNNGEASTNSAWITSSGIPFAVYNADVRASGLRTRVAPHIYWYGRFSVLAEYMDFSRELSDPTTSGRSTQRGYYVNLSYFLTGERDFAGNGFQGYSTVVPLCPFRPSKGQWGPGAWQLAAQWSQLNVGRGDFNRGFIDATRWTDRLDQAMVGINWWPNKYTRMSFDYVWTGFNNPIAVNGPSPVGTFNTFWMRFAMFF